MNLTVFHGSDHIIKCPLYHGGKPDNDYGNGFYTTEYEERAQSWAALNGSPETSYVNTYTLDLSDLEILDLNDHGVLAWIAEVIANRGTSQETTEILAKRIIQKYRIHSETADIIKGYRADDSYTQVIEAFLLNQVQILEVEKLFYKGSLGNQIFLKSSKAFSHIQWESAYQVKKKKEQILADQSARRDVNHFLNARREALLLENYQVGGITAREAVKNQYIYNPNGGIYEQASI